MIEQQRENPMGTDGFLFVEYATNDKTQLQDLFSALGFLHTGQNQQQPDVLLYEQGNIKFIINSSKDSFASKFAEQHGPSACGMAFKVNNAKYAFDRAISLGAKAYTGDTSHIGKNIYAIYGIGDSLLYLIDNFNEQQNFIPVADNINKFGVGLLEIDHLTHNVRTGNMTTWAKYYEDLFNFYEIRNFDIQGKHTGLVSKAMTAPDQKIRIPINESKDNKSQIHEYLEQYNGEGIQHIALITDDIFKTVETLKARGTKFMDTPDTYYELLNKRLPEHGEDIARLQKNKILVDGGEEQGGGYLLQIFTNTVIGPIFFEIIQRKGNKGFGEGNFQALFDSIELDQIRRGVLSTETTNN